MEKEILQTGDYWLGTVTCVYQLSGLGLSKTLRSIDGTVKIAAKKVGIKSLSVKE